jgi:hypothetical protein
MIIEPNQNSTEILQPREQPLYFPTPFVATKFSAVLRFRALAIRFMRRDQLGFKLGEAFIERITVVSLVADQSSRSFVGKTRTESLFDKSDFMRRSRFRVNGERKTSAICHCHEFRAFAPLGLSHSEAPFFATINVPSIKHSDKSSPPRECKSSAKASSTRLSVPSLLHCWNRRWQVWYGGNLPGRSHHRAPERRIQSTPFITSRSSRRGRPRVWTVSVLSKNDSINNHCSSLNSSRLAMREILSNYF